jgi:hypothetical protein
MPRSKAAPANGVAEHNGADAILTEALRLLALDYPVIPCSGKKPLARAWQTRQLDRDEVIASLHGTHHNIGLVLTLCNLIDVECDSAEAETSLQTLFGGSIPPTPTWKSKRGRHRLFQRPPDLPPKAVLKIDGIEFRIGADGKGAMSVLPPSMHPEGVPYAWLPGLRLGDVRPDELPEPIVERLRSIGGRAAAAPEGEAGNGEKISRGNRNDHLFRLACRLFRDGHEEERVIWFVLGENVSRCEPPLGEDEVVALVRSAGRQVEKGEADTYPYSVYRGRIVREHRTDNGADRVPLCNFSGRIVVQTTRDDGVEKRIVFTLEGQLANGPALPRVEVPASEFAGMNWVTKEWGTEAVVSAGTGAKDHLRAAIQLISGTVPQRTIFEHTGWREIDGKWVYLHAGGAIGAGCAVPGVQVNLLEALDLYRLPDPPTGEELREATRASLRVADVAPDVVTAPAQGGVYRCVLGSTDFSIDLAGPTGAGKTEVAALIQQHFGAGLDARHLPGSWSSTANSLETLAFHLKGAIFVVDDFAPHGSPADVARQHKDADRLLRAQGNRSGRGRCGPDGSLRPAKPPRGLILSTGEDIPKGQSLRARLCVLEVSPGDLKWDKLTEAQRDAAAGKYAAAMAGYVRWLVPQMGTIRQELPQQTARLREQVRADGQHARTPGIVADLLFGWQTFLRFAVDVGAVKGVGRDVLLMRVRQALLAAAARQAPHLESAEPAAHFLRLLGAALASGRAHVVRDTGGIPSGSSACWGWQMVDGTNRPGGRKVGWVKDKDLYLEPDAAYAAAQELARDQGESLTVSAQTLRKRLHERKLLVSTAPGKLTVRRTLEGQWRLVLHLRADSVCGAGGG